MNSEIRRQHLTVICPVFNEEKTVPLFFSRMLPVIESLSARYKVDLLFLNNASTDGTLQALRDLAGNHPFVYYISLSTNVGYQRSLECGLHHAKGELMTFIDVDCEDPPEMILDFVRTYEEGYDIVYGERIDRVENGFLKALRKLFYHVVRRVGDDEIILYLAEFAFFTAEVRDAVIRDRSSFPFIRSSIARVGFRRKGIPYKRQRRIAGETHYNFRGMTLFAVAGILSSTTLMLRLPIYLLPFWLLATGLLGAWYLRENEAWLLLLNALLFCGYIGGTIAFIALYVARTYKNGLGRPNFIVQRRFSRPQSD